MVLTGTMKYYLVRRYWPQILLLKGIPVEQQVSVNHRHRLILERSLYRHGIVVDGHAKTALR